MLHHGTTLLEARWTNGRHPAFPASTISRESSPVSWSEPVSFVSIQGVGTNHVDARIAGKQLDRILADGDDLRDRGRRDPIMDALDLKLRSQRWRSFEPGLCADAAKANRSLDNHRRDICCARLVQGSHDPWEFSDSLLKRVGAV